MIHGLAPPFWYQVAIPIPPPPQKPLQYSICYPPLLLASDYKPAFGYVRRDQLLGVETAAIFCFFSPHMQA